VAVDIAQMTDETPSVAAEPSLPESAPEVSAPSSDAPSDGSAPVEETPDPYAKVVELDPDELIRRHPKLQGKLGQLAQSQAQRLAQQEAQRLAAQQRDQEEIREIQQRRQRLDDLLDQGDTLAAQDVREEIKKLEAARHARANDPSRLTAEAESKAFQAVIGRTNEVLDSLILAQDEGIRTALAAKQDRWAVDDPLESRRLALTDLIDTVRERALAEGKRAGEKAGFEAGKKAALGEVNGHQRVDTGHGRADSGLTVEAYLAMSADERAGLSPEQRNQITAAMARAG